MSFWLRKLRFRKASITCFLICVLVSNMQICSKFGIPTEVWKLVRVHGRGLQSRGERA